MSTLLSLDQLYSQTSHANSHRIYPAKMADSSSAFIVHEKQSNRILGTPTLEMLLEYAASEVRPETPLVLT